MKIKLLPPSLSRLSVPLSTILRSKYARLLYRILTTILIWSLFLQILLAYVVARDPRIVPTTLSRAKSLLLVTAHPDDESLFFAPSVLGGLGVGRKHGLRAGLLVLSAGNNEGIGEIRKKEVKGSCEVLGVEAERCVVLDEKNLPDNPTLWWEEDAILAKVKDYIRDWNVDVILTFDDGGVSGHINHRAVSAAISKFAQTDAGAPPVYTLSSVSLPRKYTYILDLPLTSVSFSWRIIKALLLPRPGPEAPDSYSSKALVASTWGNYLKTRRAFRAHETQYSWDRNLYMLLSRYVWFNDLRRVPGPSVEPPQ